MTSETEARDFARHWVDAWNSHDVDAILSHYAADVILTSPVAAKLLGNPTGIVEGRDALRDYFKRGLEIYPDLAFKLIDVMSGLSSVVLYYENQKGTKTGEFMEFDPNGQVVRVIAHYSG